VGLSARGDRARAGVVEHDAVEIDAAHGVGIVGAVEPHLPAAGIIDAQLALVRGGAELATTYAKATQERREIGEARPHLRTGALCVSAPRRAPTAVLRSKMSLMAMISPA
jgi:hypothetical protein